MKSVSKQLGPDVLFHAIADDFSYPGINASGEKRGQPSSFPFQNFFQKMLADEALFEALRKSKGLTYLFDKTLTEINIRQEAPAGKLFYEWIRYAGFVPPPPKYESSPESALLDGIAQQLCLTAARFSSQPDPKAGAIGAIHSVLQGELIDAFGRRAFEMMQRPAFKELCKVRHKEIQSATSKTERYFGRLENNHPQLGIQRFELHYPPGTAIDIEQNAWQIDNLVATLLDKDVSGALAGYWWKRRYLPEHGLGIHLILLSCMQQGDPMHWASQQIPELWKELTKGHGIASEMAEEGATNNHRCWGAKGINLAHSCSSMLKNVMNSVRLMLESEKYLRLQPHTKIAHWGMGELPALVTQVSDTWQPTVDVKSAFDVQAEQMMATASTLPIPQLPEPPSHEADN